MNNLFVFHGIDHKCGTTMVAQSIAELIAEANKELDILLISLNGRKSAEFVRENAPPIDYFKLQLDSGIPVDKGLLIKNKRKENLYIIGGIERELEERYYLPETAVKLLTDVGEHFNIIIADTGSQIDNGLAIGGLSLAEKRFVVMAQSEAAVTRYERVRSVYEKAGVSFDHCIVNKYCQKDPYSINYISERLEIDKKNCSKIEMVGYGRQAEMEYRTLLEYGQDKYTEDILKIANIIGESMQIPEFKLKRRGLWKSFI